MKDLFLLTPLFMKSKNDLTYPDIWYCSIMPSFNLFIHSFKSCISPFPALAVNIYSINSNLMLQLKMFQSDLRALIDSDMLAIPEHLGPIGTLSVKILIF